MKISVAYISVYDTRFRLNEIQESRIGLVDGMSTIVGYLMRNSLYTYLLNMSDF